MRRWLFLVLILFGAAGLAPGPALAQSGPRVVALRQPAYTFGGEVTFSLLVAGEAEILDVNLLLKTPDEPRTFVGKARFVKGQRVEATYVLEPGRRRLLPFAPVTYWWEARDADGRTLTTERQSFVYADNRFEWQTLTDGPITVAWHTGDREYAQLALDAAVAGLARANRDIQAPLPEAVTVYLYPSLAQAREALVESGRLWSDAHANPLFGAVVVTLPPGDVDTPVRAARDIPHELTHILIAQKTGDRFYNVPAWLQEGLAVTNEAAPDADQAAALKAALDADDLLPLAELCGPFSPDPVAAQLAYAQSESVVRYIRDRYGAQAFDALLRAYADGVDCAGGVQRALGMTLEELEEAWLQSSLQANPLLLRVRWLGPWLAVAGLVLSGSGLFWLFTSGLKAARPVV